MTGSERGPIRSETSDLTPGDMLKVSVSPMELADDLSEAELRDRIAIWDEEAEIQRDIIREAETRRTAALHHVQTAQEALRLKLDRGLE